MKITSSQMLMPLIKQSSAILFDLDGTLFNLHIQWQDIRQHILSHYKRTYGIEIPEKKKFFKIFRYIRTEQGDQAFQYYQDYMRNQELIALKEKRFEPLKLFTMGIEKMAEHLRFDCFFGIVSNNFHETILEILNQFGSNDKFKVIIGRNDVSNEKPNPEGLIRIMDGYDLLPEKVLFIGDSKVDEEAAERAQINFIYVDDLNRILKIEE
ncbi:Phosphoglycolate phosphatase [Candidatus Lokiarchaeum ossiferum]|uniref:Phosphoglycolate phosphatase n=1 Tax=Candidatus Lokiarchaeum ossiferum TaxID=2951803 RepID=A0ABY6HXA9_9ARCH|nr:Phosphoglycolate phosphatase [Candidatus Lokiarchaeum sp. B-35]